MAIDPTILSVLTACGGGGVWAVADRVYRTWAGGREADRRQAAAVARAREEAEPKRIETIGQAWELQYDRLNKMIEVLQGEVGRLTSRITALEGELLTARKEQLTAEAERNKLKNAVAMASFAKGQVADAYNKLARGWNVLVPRYRAAVAELRQRGVDTAAIESAMPPNCGPAVMLTLEPVLLLAETPDPLTLAAR